jgi:hypothetical protein
MELSQRLLLFNQKVELLTQRSFFRQLVAEHANVNLKWDKEGGWRSSFTGPNDESIEAAVLTIRQFMQNNDPISIGNVADVYAKSLLPQPIKNEFEMVRGWLNEYLDRPSNISVEESRRLTNRELLHTFVYGGLGHSSEPHFSRYHRLINSPFGQLVKLLFVDVLSKFLTGLRQLATVNAKALDLVSRPA